MAIVQHRLYAWIWQGTAADRRTGILEMSRAQFDAAAAEGRAQDMRIGSLHLKHVTRELYVPPDPPPEGGDGEAAPVARRRRRGLDA